MKKQINLKSVPLHVYILFGISILLLGSIVANIYFIACGINYHQELEKLRANSNKNKDTTYEESEISEDTDENEDENNEIIELPECTLEYLSTVEDFGSNTIETFQGEITYLYRDSTCQFNISTHLKKSIDTQWRYYIQRIGETKFFQISAGVDDQKYIVTVFDYAKGNYEIIMDLKSDVQFEGATYFGYKGKFIFYFDIPNSGCESEESCLGWGQWIQGICDSGEPGIWVYTIETNELEQLNNGYFCRN